MHFQPVQLASGSGAELSAFKKSEAAKWRPVWPPPDQFVQIQAIEVHCMAFPSVPLAAFQSEAVG